MGLFLSLGFWGMGFGSLFGSLLAAKNHLALVAESSHWIHGLQRALLRSAHAHWNSMCITWILFGLTISHAFGNNNQQPMLFVSCSALIGPIFFVFGIITQSYTSSTHLGATLLSAFGGSLYLLSTIYWGCLIWIRRVEND